MPRKPRRDRPNRFHHVMNRAGGRLIMFADQTDFRRFTALLACSVRRGEIEIAAYSLLSTHFHLLARSPKGRISYALMRIQNAYSRHRNRRRRKDGSLVRGRFQSKPVLSWRYFHTLVRYIDNNPVHAGLATHPFDYPHGSAARYARTVIPPWLDSGALLRHLSARRPESTLCPQTYARAFGSPLTEGEFEVVERRLARPGDAEDDLDALMRSPPPFLARWMARKIRDAGHRSPWTPIAAPVAICAVLGSARAEIGEWVLAARRSRTCAWAVMEAGLLKTLASLTIDEIAKRQGVHRSTSSLRARYHMELMTSDAVYAEAAGRVMRSALDETYRCH